MNGCSPRWRIPPRIKNEWRRPEISRNDRAILMSAKKLTEAAGTLTKELTVVNKLGIHARPAAMFVKTASRFACEIFVEKDGEKVNGKSIMGLMMLAAGPGCKLTIHAAGQDASNAVSEIEELLKRKFDED
jgi:phosphocarrier protein HPr